MLHFLFQTSLASPQGIFGVIPYFDVLTQFIIFILGFITLEIYFRGIDPSDYENNRWHRISDLEKLIWSYAAGLLMYALYLGGSFVATTFIFNTLPIGQILVYNNPRILQNYALNVGSLMNSNGYLGYIGYIRSVLFLSLFLFAALPFGSLFLFGVLLKPTTPNIKPKEFVFVLLLPYFLLFIFDFILGFLITANHASGVLYNNLQPWLIVFSNPVMPLFGILVIGVIILEMVRFLVRNQRRLNFVNLRRGLHNRIEAGGQKLLYYSILFAMMVLPILYAYLLVNQPIVANAIYTPTALNVAGQLTLTYLNITNQLTSYNTTRINDTIVFRGGLSSIVLPLNQSSYSPSQLNSLGHGILPNGTVDFNISTCGYNLHCSKFYNQTQGSPLYGKYLILEKNNAPTNNTAKSEIVMHLNSTSILSKLLSINYTKHEIKSTWLVNITFKSNANIPINLHYVKLILDTGGNYTIFKASISGENANSICQLSSDKTVYDCYYLAMNKSSATLIKVSNTPYTDINGEITPMQTLNVNLTLQNSN